MWYVYIIECKDGKLYTGLTNDLDRRFKEHKHKGSHFTSYNPALKVLHQEIFQDKLVAAKREKQIKGWTRAKKLALAKGDIVSLKLLSKRGLTMSEATGYG